MKSKDGDLSLAMVVDTSQTESAFQRVQSTFSNMTNQMSRQGQALNSIFAQFGSGLALLGLGATIEQIIQNVVGLRIEFEKAMREVATLSSEISSKLDAYTESIAKMTTEIPIGATEAAKALYQIVSAGHDGAAGMQVLEVSAKAAIGGVTDTATAADAITTVLNAYKREASDAEAVSDAMFKTVKLGKTSFGELGQSIAQVAPLAASYGIRIEEVLAMVASLTKQGTPTAQAMTQIRAAITGCVNSMGDAAFKGRTLQETFVEATRQANNSTSSLKTNMGTIEAVSAILGVTGKNAESAAADLAEVTNAAGAATEAFEIMNASSSNQFKLLANNILDYLAPIGNAIRDTFSSAAQSLNDAFADGSITENLKTVGGLITAATAAYVAYHGSIAAVNAVKRINYAITRMVAEQRAYEISLLTAGNAMTRAQAAAIVGETSVRSVLTKAIKAQTIALLKNTAAMLTNPYVLLAAAVAALGYAFYKLATAETEAEKMQREYAQSIENLNEKQRQAKERTDELIAAATDEAAATLERDEAIQQLISTYPNIIEKYIDEEGHLTNIIGLKRELAGIEAQKKSVALEQQLLEAEYQLRVQRNYIASATKIHPEDSERLAELERQVSDLRTRVDNNRVSSKFEEFKQLSDDDLKAKIEEIENSLAQGFGLMYQVGIDSCDGALTTYVNRSLSYQATEDLKNKLQRLYDERTGANDGDAVKNEAYWSKRKADAERALKAMSDDKVGTEEWNKQKRIIAEADRHLKRYSSTAEDAASKLQSLRDAQANYNKAVEDNARTERRAQEDLERRMKAASLDVDKDSRSKRIKKMRQDHDKEIAELQREKEDYIKAYLDRRKAEFDANEAIKATQSKTYVKQQFDPRTVDTSSVGTEFDDIIRDTILRQQRELNELQKEEFENLINNYGNYYQKRALLMRQWEEQLAEIPAEYAEQAKLNFAKALAELDSEEFQKNMNWDNIFGNLGEQSIESLQISLEKVKKYLATESKNLTVEQLKIYQEAIDKIEEEIASRNPFTAMHKSFNDISAAKTDLVSALEELAQAQRELTAAEDEYNRALATETDLRKTVKDAGRETETDALILKQHEVIDAENAYQAALAQRESIQQKIDNGEIDDNSQEAIDAQQALVDAERVRNELLAERDALVTNMNDADLAQSCIQLAKAQDTLNASTTTLTNAQKKNAQAEQHTLTARNKVTKSYKTFANNLSAAGKVTTDVGKKASNLARIFSDDIADGMDKALDCIDEVLEATGDVISAIGDVGKKVSKDVTKVAEDAGEGVKSTAKATATSISTVEKASIILTVISAALQIATAIANLFNDDDSKQKEIERLQQRIDQLQWELDNQDAIRLQQNTASAMQKLKDCYAEARREILALHNVTQSADEWTKYFVAAHHQGEIYAKTIEKIADYWAQVNYTADKALGVEKYTNARKQLENLAEQQVLIQQQMYEEMNKKKSDASKVQDYKNKIAELAEEMATLINELLEDIIGASAEDISKTLGDAFIEAARAGEDAMKAWGDTVNDIVADILKRMMIQQIIEPEIGKIFDKYKKKWFGDDGVFRGFDAVQNSMNDFASDINAVSALFGQMFDEMPEDLKNILISEQGRTAAHSGIATASQDSVDENNARLTTIQSHTYTLVQGVAELNATGTQILDRLASIDNNTDKTADALDTVREDIRRVKNAVEDITTQGLKIK